MGFLKNSFFSHDPDKIREEMERLNLSPFDKTAKQGTSDAMKRQVQSWATEITDVIFELEENEPVDDQIVRLRAIQTSMEDVLESMRHEASATDSPDRPTGIR